MIPPRAFTEGFRLFFLAAGLWAVVSVALWLGWLELHDARGVMINPPFSIAPHLWHAHEMIFGYAAAVIGGFFLTAAPNWTGGPPAQAAYVSGAALVWLAGRLAIWMSGALDARLVAAIDLAFLPFLAIKIALMLLKRPKPQNVILLGVLSVVWAGNLMTHLDWCGAAPGLAESGLRLGLGAICVLIAAIGGRVTPAFTRNAMRREGREDRLPRSFRTLELTAILGAALTTLLWTMQAAPTLLAVVALATGAAQLARVALWRPGWALRQPIIWSLHLGMVMLGAGWLALGLSSAGLAIPESAALHLLGIGAVGGMTLAVMSRAALGHTGRPLKVSALIALAYALIALAALIRFVGPAFLPEFYALSLTLSAAFWILGFALFVLIYLPILTGPRLA